MCLIPSAASRNNTCQVLSSREVHLSQIFPEVWSHRHRPCGLHSLDTASPLDHLGKDSYDCRTLFTSEVPRCQPRPALSVGLCKDSSLRPPVPTLFHTDPVPQALLHETLNIQVLNQSPLAGRDPKEELMGAGHIQAGGSAQ